MKEIKGRIASGVIRTKIIGILMTEEEKQKYLNYELSIVVVKETLSGAFNCTDQVTQKTIRYPTFDDIPDNIKGPLSIVKMLDVGHSIIAAGKKIGNGLYWVYVWV